MRTPVPGRGPMTFAQYLAFEEASPLKHEFVAGDVYVMTGVTRRHSLITLNVASHLRTAARAGSCRVYASEVKVRVASDVVYYPDVAVECGAHDPAGNVIDEPCLVVEVASRSTRRIDRGEKLANYKAVPSLRGYLMIEQNHRRVTFWSRDDAGDWTAIDLFEAGSMTIPCPAVQLTLDQIYEDVEMPPLGVAEPEVDEETGEYITG